MRIWARMGVEPWKTFPFFDLRRRDLIILVFGVEFGLTGYDEEHRRARTSDHSASLNCCLSLRCFELYFDDAGGLGGSRLPF